MNTLVQGTKSRNASVESVIFWEDRFGFLMLAPHQGMKPFPGMERVECQTAHDIERYSRRLEAQEATKVRNLSIEEQLRASKTWKEIADRCKKRLADGCISAADEIVNRNVLANMEKNFERLGKIITGQLQMNFSGALEIERKESTKGMAQYQQKKVTL